MFLNPTATAQDSARRLSLWLYHVCEDEHVKNAPAVRSPTATFRMTPLALDLYYLLTPFATSGEADHLLLGKAMQTFHDTATARVVDTHREGRQRGAADHPVPPLARRDLAGLAGAAGALPAQRLLPGQGHPRRLRTSSTRRSAW